MWTFNKSHQASGIRHRISGAGGWTVCTLSLLWLTGMGWADSHCAPPGPRSPKPGTRQSAVFTATGTIRALATDKSGAVWAATEGGVVRWDNPDTEPIRWTTADSLGSDDVRAICVWPEGGLAALPLSVQPLSSGGGAPASGIPFGGAEVHDLKQVGSVTWAATSAGLFRRAMGEKEFTWVGGAKPGAHSQVWRLAEADGAVWFVGVGGVSKVGERPVAGLPEGAANAAVTAFAVNEGTPFLATATGFWRLVSGKWQPIPLPAGTDATHVSALLPSNVPGKGDHLRVGLYGAGVYSLLLTPKKPPTWFSLSRSPFTCQGVTTLAWRGDDVLIGTAQDGVWVQHPGRPCKRLPLTGALPSGNIQAVTEFDGALWAATFDRGVFRLDPATSTVTPQGMESGSSSPSPRSFAVFKDHLYVRHTTGAVDTWDTARGHWVPAFPGKTLLRPQAYSLAASEKRLIVGGWAGWAAFDGMAWEQHWTDLELAGQVVTAVAPDPRTGDVWLGTQGKGLFRWHDGAYTQYHESSGLTDDWITAIAIRNGRVLVGTYTGGLLERSGERFVLRFAPERFAIRALGFLPDGSALAATPIGVYRETATAWRPLDSRTTGGLEAQALCLTPDALWVGTRTSLARAPL